MTPPDERVLRLHLESGRFRSGAARGWWRFVDLRWPHTVIAITACDGVEYGMRFHCVNYPRTPVTGQPWDLAAGKPLPPKLWPGGRGRVPLAFNPDWKNGTCLYLPCDRQSIEGHDNWRNEHPALLWDPEKGLCKYLGIVHELLNSTDYGGRRAA
jgi:hypothetical protein